ncbi:MAG: DNA lyase [Bacteroidetes bacterium]|nr:DNA lyase [Bacteroidota bacterium]
MVHRTIAPSLPEEYAEHYRRHAEAIRARLLEFRQIPESEYLNELLFCLLTPGSRAAHAEQVMAALRARGFLERPFDPTPYLRDPAHYIRFHNQKARRLVAAASNGAAIMDALTDRALDWRARRVWLVEHVNGLGWKEASHFLRNIGAQNLAIIDRHILKHLLRCGAIDAMPKALTRRGYAEIEERFAALADRMGLALQELDLLFWSFEEGSVRK